jgi:hypothetical protein
MTVAILATGPSLPGLLAELPPAIPRIAVNHAFRLAPDAIALVGADQAWWSNTPEAESFAGRKFSTHKIPGIERVPMKWPVANGLSSGGLAIIVARMLGYRRLLLLGFDGHGSHFHGEYPPPLKNPGEAQFRLHEQQFKRLRFDDTEIINCTPGSRYTAFPRMSLSEALNVQGSQAVQVASPRRVRRR